MTHPNEDLIRRGYEAFSRADVPTMSELLTDDVVWHVPGHGPLAGDHEGKDAVLAMFARLAEITGGTFRIEVHDILANDEHGVALQRATAERGGKSWEGISVQVFHFRDGKASESWLHPFDLYASDEFLSG